MPRGGRRPPVRRRSDARSLVLGRAAAGATACAQGPRRGVSRRRPSWATNDAGAGARFPSGLSRRARGAAGRRSYHTERRSSSRTTSRHRTSRSPRALSPIPAQPVRSGGRRHGEIPDSVTQPRSRFTDAPPEVYTPIPIHFTTDPSSTVRSPPANMCTPFDPGACDPSPKGVR